MRGGRGEDEAFANAVVLFEGPQSGSNSAPSLGGSEHSYRKFS